MPLANLLPCKNGCQRPINQDTAKLALRAIRIDQRSIPYMNPLYWKWIWSTMRKPGCKNMDADTIRCNDGSTDPRTKLCGGELHQLTMK